MINNKLLRGTLTFVLVAGIVTPAFAAISGFQQIYDPSNWTFNANGGDGSVDTTNAPAKIMITGNDNNQLSIQTEYTITMQCAGTVKFDWTYDGEPVTGFTGPQFDPSGYLLNGVQNQLTDNGGAEVQSGTNVVVPVVAGDVFGWYIFSTDGVEGPGIFTMIENFEGPACIVGGNIIPIDTSALFLAGIQGSTIWMIPTIAGIAGTGFYLIKFRTNKD